MIRDFICPVCHTHIGRGHGYQEGDIISHHIELVHPKEYKEIAKVQAGIDKIERKYKIYSRDLFYYH